MLHQFTIGIMGSVLLIFFQIKWNAKGTLGTGECFIERYCLLFQKISPTVPLQYLHLLDCNLVELYQAFALRHTVAKEFHRVSIAKPIGHKEIAIFGFQHICNADVILTVYIRDCYLRVLDCYLCHIAFSYSRPTWGILCTKIRRIIESKTFLNENLHKTAQNRLIVPFDWHKFLSSECNECLHFCHLTGWTALCSLLSGRQQGSVKPTARRRVTVSREGVGVCLLPKDARFTYCSLVVYLLGTMTPPNRSDFL